MRRVLVVLFLFLACVGIAGGDSVKWRAIRTGHFIVFYSPRDLATAKRAGAIGEEWWGKISKRLGFETGVVPIYLYPDRTTFSEATGVPSNDSIVGLAHSQLHDIRVDASGAFADISRIIPHELVHVFVAEMLGDNDFLLPTWVQEGLAKYYGNDWSDADSELLADSVYSGRILPLGKISEGFPKDPNDRAIAYSESYSAIDYISRTYGESSLKELLSETKSGRAFPIAFGDSTSVDLEKFEAAWRDDLEERYRVGRWLRIAESLIWPTMALVAILAFRARLAWKRKKAQEFEEEDRLAQDPREFL